MTERKELVRALGFWTAAAVVVGDMIGSGIFTTTGFIAADIPDPMWILALWLIGGALALMGAFSVGEIGAMLPYAGGDYVYCYHSYGSFVAFMSGWISLFVGFSAPIAAMSIAIVEYFGYYLPFLSPTTVEPVMLGFLPLHISWGHACAIFLIFLVAFSHYTGQKTSRLLQNSLSALKVFLIFILIALGLSLGDGSWGHFSVPASALTFSGKIFKSGVALIFITFAYTGWNAASYIAGEIKDAGRVLPRALILGTTTVTLLYLGLNVFYFYALPVDKAANVLRIGAVSAEALFGPGIAGFTNVLFIIAMLGCLSAMIFLGPRIYYAMAKDNLFFQPFSRVHPRFQTPGTAIWLQAAWASVLVISGRFDQILIYAGFILSIFMSLSVAGVYILRRKMPERERPYKTWGYPVTPFLFIILNAWIVVYAVAGRPMESLLGLLTIIAGIPFYIYFRRTGVQAGAPSE